MLLSESAAALRSANLTSLSYKGKSVAAADPARSGPEGGGRAVIVSDHSKEDCRVVFGLGHFLADRCKHRLSELVFEIAHFSLGASRLTSISFRLGKVHLVQP